MTNQIKRLAATKVGRFALSTGVVCAVASPVAFTPADAAPKAPTGTAAPNLFATVHLDGYLVHGGGVANVNKLGTGVYEVTFGTDVRGCAYVATPLNGGSQAVTVFTAGGHFGPNGVYVEVKNQGGGLTDNSFNLHVNCGTPGNKFAVVNTSGKLVRSSTGATITDLGSGRYNVDFGVSVASCAYLATVGDPANGLVYYPAGVYTGTGPGTNAVYIETKNPGGGLTSGIPFHLSVVCDSAANTKNAVIKADGMPARGSTLTSTFRPTTGARMMVTDRPITSCATILTRGSIDRSVPYTPATVEVNGTGHPNTASLNIRSLLFFGGSQIDEAIHAAVIC